MIDVDMSLVEIKNNAVILTDLWSTKNEMPIVDTVQSLNLLNS
jgi:hypothetical protein